ncbi:MAG TPA: glycoside hydrolase family 3 N-terminal domain-containing protein [Longimicrobium sp.]|uniref:glycoside hydrolase family 3 protein n=1 Tax=Longimicrobium sp. TaxID=2029185 RepID=UPI002EDB9D8F
MLTLRGVGGWLAVMAMAACSSPGAGAHAVQGDSAPAPRDMPVQAAPAVQPLQTDAQGRAWVDGTLAGMTLRQRVAQLVFPWISGRSATQNPEEMERMLASVTRDEVGGFIISTGSPGATAAKLNAAQARAPVPLLIVSDLETGPGVRLTPGGTRMPPAMAFGAAGDTALAREAGRVTGLEARAVGIQMTLGPIMDVNGNPRNPIINIRSFGESPDAVARLSAAWVAGARQGDLLTVGKHYPGHGDTHADSHVGLVSIDADAARLRRVEFVPFEAGIRAGMDGVLAGHIAAPGVEGANAPPASQSPRLVQQMLRGELNFRGIVFTDALNMQGATQGISVTEASIRSLLAGADALLQPPEHTAVIDGIVAAVESGRIPRARIDEAARRVLTAKAAAGLHRAARVDPAAAESVTGAAAHVALADSVAARSMTLVRNRGGLVPLARGARVLHVTYSNRGGSPSGSVLQRVLAAGTAGSEFVRVGASTPASTFARLTARAAQADVVVVSVAVVPVQYQGLGLSGGFGPWVQSVAASGRKVIVVSLGSPYLLDAFPAVPGYLLAWDVGESAESAAGRSLLGQAGTPGHLPVSLPPHHRLGEGIVLGQ